MSDATKLIERLRNGSASFATLKMNALEAADLIEQQAAHIAELERERDEARAAEEKVQELHDRLAARIAELEARGDATAGAEPFGWVKPAGGNYFTRSALSARRIGGLVPVYAAPVADSAMAKDAERLDFLDAMNARKNAQYGTRYGWGLTENHNRIALEDHHFPVLTVREAIDAAIAASAEKTTGK